MKRRAFVIAVLSMPAIAHAQIVTELYTMRIGESRTRALTDVQSYSMSGPGLVDTSVSPDGHIVFTGRALGQTVILLIRTDGTQVRCLCTVVP